MEVSIPDPFLLEEGIIERITLLKEAVKKAMTKKQEAKDQVKKSQATSDKATTDRSSNSDLDESENDPELPIEIAQEASPSLTEQTYEAHMEELWSINSLVEQIVKNIIWIRRDKQGYRVTQKAAIKRSRGYLQELTNIGNLMMKTWGTLPEKSKFKDGDGLLELLLRVDEFKAITDDALLRSRWEHIKGREGLVTSKEKLDKKKKKLHKTTILEETEDEEEEQDAKYRAVYEQSDKK
ncbi:hypothetical protein BASA81_002889 [Batrachochytrium salamandrivorans]|nr:hypothetical protein BASA62_001507 [Batrachochytrium salamandrivorans]KAH9258825.1 hypothetical protein BASA81_002889 [Batrachochytrium salamandrivorans]